MLSNSIAHFILALTSIFSYAISAQEAFPNEINSAIIKLNQNLKLINQDPANLPGEFSFFRQFSSKAFTSDYEKSTLYTRNNVSSECSAQISHFVQGLVKKETWAIRILDAFGKPPSGILEGNFVWIGDYRECINVTNSQYNWTSKFCSITKSDNNGLIDVSDYTTFLKYGICVPSECSRDDIVSILNSFLRHHKKDDWELNGFLENSSFTIQNINCQEPKYLDTPSIVIISVAASIVSLILLATVVDIYKSFVNSSHFRNEIKEMFGQGLGESINETEVDRLISNNLEEHYQIETKLMQLISNLSLRNNIKRVFNTKVENNSQLACLHAIRFLSLAWVILGHSYGFMFMFSDNLAAMTDLLQNFWFQIVANGFFSVDTFFVLSGLLTSYTFMKEFTKRNSELSLCFMIKYYFHRFFRLTPPYLLVLLFSVYMSKYLGSGPFFPTDGFERRECKATWWWNLLYINNLFSMNDSCLPITWYLANDMQFHWFAPLFLIPLAYGRYIIGTFLVILFVLGSILSTFAILIQNPGSEQGLFGPKADIYNTWVYIKPWARCGAFLVGLLLGYILFVRKTTIRSRTRINPILNLANWLFTFIIIFSCIFIVYPDAINFPIVYYSRAFHIAYLSISKVIWALAVAYVIYACETYNGGIVKKLLTLKLWLPLSRLSYSAYLIHSTVIFYFFSTSEKPMHMQGQPMFVYFIGNMIVSYVAAFFVTIFFELPFIGVEKVFLR